MQRRILPAIFLSMLMTWSAYAQDSASTPAQQQNDQRGTRQRGGGGRGSWGVNMGILGGRGIMGTVTEIAAEHFVARSEDGQT